MYRPPTCTESSMWSAERAVTTRRGFLRRDGDHRTDVYVAFGYAICRPSVASPETPCSVRNDRGTLPLLPVSAEATRILVSRPRPGDSGQPTRRRPTRKEPCACPRWMIVPRPVRRSYTWTAPIPPGPVPCTQVAIPFNASGARKGLGRNSAADAREAAPTCVTCPERESQAQTVKSSRPVREWYSDQTSQRPSKAPSAWSAAGSGNALMCLTALVLASISA